MTDAAHVEGDMRKRSRPAAELSVIVSDAVNKVTAGFRLTAPGVGDSDAFLRSDLLFELGELLDLTIDLPGAGPLLVRARVERVARGTANEPLTGMAVALVDLSPSGRATLEAALR